MDSQNIKSTFSPKSDLALSEIMKKNKLQGSSVEFLLEKITMFFSRGEISEKKMVDSVRKETRVPQKIAVEIATEIKNNIIPTLWNNLSEEEKEKLLHQKIQKKKPSVGLNAEKKEAPRATKMKLSNQAPQKINSSNNKLPPKKSPPVNKISKPDSYRESIE